MDETSGRSSLESDSHQQQPQQKRPRTETDRDAERNTAEVHEEDNNDLEDDGSNDNLLGSPQVDNGEAPTSSGLEVNRGDGDGSGSASPQSSDGISGLVAWIENERSIGTDPFEILINPPFNVSREMLAQQEFSKERLWILVHQLLQPVQGFQRPRERTPLTSLEDVVDTIRKATKILVLTGAGVSTSCGIPDFRSANGIYARLKTDYPTLPNPQAMFSMDYFKSNPRPFFDFAQEIYPGNFQPAPSHHFIRQIEANGKLLRNYTQNIDTLEQVAGISNIVQCHGSFNTASCLVCKHTVSGESIKDQVMAKEVPLCKQPSCADSVARYKRKSEEASQTRDIEPLTADKATAPAEVSTEHVENADDGAIKDSSNMNAGQQSDCDLNDSPRSENENPAAYFLKQIVGGFQNQELDPVIKPDIIFFGQNLPDHFFDALENDCEEADLVIVIGSSLKVSPVAEITQMVRDQDVPQILVNREPLPHKKFSAELLGDCDGILAELAAHLGWKLNADSMTSSKGTPTATVSKTESINDGEGVSMPSENRNGSENSEHSKHLGRTTDYEFQGPNRFVFPGAVLEYAPSEGSPPPSDDLSDDCEDGNADPSEHGIPDETEPREDADSEIIHDIAGTNNNVAFNTNGNHQTD